MKQKVTFFLSFCPQYNKEFNWSTQKKKKNKRRLCASLIYFLIFYSKKNMCHTLHVGSAYG